MDTNQKEAMLKIWRKKHQNNAASFYNPITPGNYDSCEDKEDLLKPYTKDKATTVRYYYRLNLLRDEITGGGISDKKVEDGYLIASKYA